MRTYLYCLLVLGFALWGAYHQGYEKRGLLALADEGRAVQAALRKERDQHAQLLARLDRAAAQRQINEKAADGLRAELERLQQRIAHARLGLLPAASADTYGISAAASAPAVVSAALDLGGLCSQRYSELAQHADELERRLMAQVAD